MGGGVKKRKKKERKIVLYLVNYVKVNRKIGKKKLISFSIHFNRNARRLRTHFITFQNDVCKARTAVQDLTLKFDKQLLPFKYLLERTKTSMVYGQTT